MTKQEKIDNLLNTLSRPNSGAICVDDELSQVIIGWKTQSEHRMEHILELQKIVNGLRNNLQDKIESEAALQVEVANLKKSVEVKDETITRYFNWYNDDGCTIERLRKQLAELRTEHESYLAKHQERADAFRDLTEEVEALKTTTACMQLERDNAIEERDALSDELFVVECERNSLKQEVKDLGKMVDTSQRNWHLARTNADELRAKLAEVRGDRDTAITAHNDALHEITRLNDELKSIKEVRDFWYNEHHDVRKQRDNARSELAGVQARCNSEIYEKEGFRDLATARLKNINTLHDTISELKAQLASLKARMEDCPAGPNRCPSQYLRF